jgi:DNA invertase Pin-like site-specific DNA recombinase
MRERRARDKSKNRRYDSITGEKNRLAKLTEEKVREIRLLYSLGSLSQSKLASMFGVKKSTIRHVLEWNTWKHVT